MIGAETKSNVPADSDQLELGTPNQPITFGISETNEASTNEYSYEVANKNENEGSNNVSPHINKFVEFMDMQSIRKLHTSGEQMAPSLTDIENNDPVILGFDPAYLEEFKKVMFIGIGSKAKVFRRLFNFFSLLIFAIIIATFGVLSDSTATVIGAMIVAPLMGPIMATAAGVVMGSFRRALRAFVLTFLGVSVCVVFSYILAWFIPCSHVDFACSFTENSNLASRVHPNIYSLLCALGSGSAGAFIMSRVEIADSIGGVAIAISLVPPLCVVGIALQQFNPAAAGGAFSLFMINYLSILSAGSIVFLLSGLGKIAKSKHENIFKYSGIIVFVLAIAAIAIPLAIFTFHDAFENTMNTQAYDTTAQWIGDADYAIIHADVDTANNYANVLIEGVGALPDTQDLANQLSNSLGQTVNLRIGTVSSITVQSS